MRGWLVAAFIALVATSAFAQGNSTFNGRVVDNSDAVLPGVTITVTNKATGVVRTTVTNENGQWALPGLEPGMYEVKSELPGFQTSARDNVGGKRKIAEFDGTIITDLRRESLSPRFLRGEGDTPRSGVRVL